MLVSVDFRPLSFADFDAAYVIEMGAYEHPWSESLFRDSLTAPMTHQLALFDAELRAYAIYQVIFTEAHLLNLAVSNAYQGRGYGRALLEEVMRDSARRGALQMYLEVRPTNQRAKQLYEALSFKRAMIRQRYYPDGEDAEVMFCDLREFL